MLISKLSESYARRFELLGLCHMNEFETSVPQSARHYCPAGNGDMLDVAVRQYVRLSGVVGTNKLDSDQLQIILHIMHKVYGP
jgi:hypothetical protein